jgi:hypothetical protein
MPLFVPENKGCLPMLRNGKIADELEEIAPLQYALITVGHTKMCAFCAYAMTNLGSKTLHLGETASEALLIFAWK